MRTCLSMLFVDAVRPKVTWFCGLGKTVYLETALPKIQIKPTGSSRLMRISLLRILLLGFFKTITIILLMRLHGLFILLVRPLAKNLANANFFRSQKSH